jgi:hypothetical protein
VNLQVLREDLPQEEWFAIESILRDLELQERDWAADLLQIISAKLNSSCPVGLMAQPAAPEQKPDDDENWWQKEWRRKSHITRELGSSERRKSDDRVIAKIPRKPVNVKHRKSSRDDAQVNQRGAE